MNKMEFSDRVRACYVNPERLPEVQALFEERLEKAIEDAGFDPAKSKNEFSFSPEGFWALKDCWDRVHEAYTLTPEGFESTGLVDVVCERRVTTQLDIDGVQEIVYNAVDEPFHQMNGYSVEVDKFRLSHLQYQMEIIIRKDGGFTDKDIKRYTQGRYHDIDKFFCFTLMTPDGIGLLPEGDMAFIDMVTELNGERVARVFVENEGIIDLEKLDQLMLVPYTGYWGDEFYAAYHMDEAVTITPTVTEEVVDPNAVWCTLNGTYYHSEQYCMGMRGAQETTAEEAEQLGKLPCPECR